MSVILIVDDDANCAALWARVLEGTADKFLAAHSIAEAIEKMANIPPPDLVLLDLKIPPHSAEHTLAAIQAFREYNPDLKVIAVSGMTVEEINAAIRTTGAAVQAIVHKGDMDSQRNLLDAVQTLLSGSRGFRDSQKVLETMQNAVKKSTDKIDSGAKDSRGTT
jgi:CheY-like chemotaxis protein